MAGILGYTGNSPNAKEGKKKKGDVSVCPICTESIVEQTKTKKGQDAIFCEGLCKAWLHRRCAGLSTIIFNELTNSKVPFCCPHCRLKTNENELAILKASVASLENKISNLEDQLKAKDTPVKSKVNNDVDVSGTPSSTNVDSSSQIQSMVNSFINEEKEKAKRRLNLIVHNVTESTNEDGLIRKKHDIDYVTSTIQQYLGVNVTINKAFRLGQRNNKPRLLKISVNSEAEKALVLRNAIKLKNVDHPDEIQQLFITPDLTSKEQQANRKLREELKELNKESKTFYIKNGKIVQRRV